MLTVHTLNAWSNDEDGMLISGAGSTASGVTKESVKSGKCAATDHLKRGICVRDGAAMTMHAVVASQNTGDGLLLMGSGGTADGAMKAAHASMELMQCRAEGNEGCGVCVKAGAALTAKTLHACNNKTGGVLIEGSGSPTHGTKTFTLSSAKVTDCSATENAVSGVQVRGGASLTAQAVHALDNAAAGLLLEGSGSSVVASNLTAKSNRDSGVHVHTAAHLRADRFTAAENHVAGLRVEQHAVARVMSACISGTVAGSGVVADSHGSALLMLYCKVFDNSAYGLLSQGAATIKMSSYEDPSRVEGNHRSNARVTGGGCLLLDNVKLSGSQAGGVVADGEGTSAMLADCTVSDNGAAGLAVHGGATLTCQRSTVADN